MINTIADLLNKFKEKEVELMKQYEIVKHPGIIGDMYEGLSKNILEKTIFEGLDLKVISGKIKNDNGVLSEEIDCMLVGGNVDQIPHTDKYICNVKDVLAVIQVKKNLYSKEINDSYFNLKSVSDLFLTRDIEEWQQRLLKDSYRLIVRKEVPTDKEYKFLPLKYQMIYHSLLMNTYYPIRIVWGYNGFKSEFQLRESFYNYIDKIFKDDDKSKRAFTPKLFPNLIICGKHCIIKNDGMPFAKHLNEEDFWSILITSTGNPLYFILELIWTRLAYKYRISPTIFGDDFQNEMNIYIDCKYVIESNLKGWKLAYLSYTKEQLEENTLHVDWKPIRIDVPHFEVFQMLIEDRIIYIYDNKFDKILRKYNLNIDNFIKELIQTGLIFEKNNRLILLVDECTIGHDVNFGYYAADNKDNKLTIWLEKQ